jgi:hypothetical protein
MPRSIAALPLLILAAACNGPSSDSVVLTNASPEEVAQKAGAVAPARLQPGQWETTVEIAQVDMPGMPAAVRDQMKSSTTQKQSVTTCITPEQAAKPQADVLAGNTGGRCTYRNYAMAGGKIDATLVCAGPGNGETVQTISGTFTETAFSVTSDLKTAGGPGETMSMKSKTSGRRIGECKA